MLHVDSAVDDSANAAPTRPPVVTSAAAQFLLPDRPGVDGVRLEADFDLGVDPEFTQEAGGWQLLLPRPEIDRLEYQFTVRSGEHTEWITDPGNPRTVPNPFGDKSEIRFPEYAVPGWLATPLTGSLREVTVDRGSLEIRVPVRLWAPEGLPDRIAVPLLIAHDGSDLADRGSLLRWASRLSAGTPFRVALLDPPVGYRHRWYSADTDYADHVAGAILPALRDRVAVGSVLGLGVSLGAVSMLTIQRRHPDALQGLALQSGSFFTHRLDPQESGYSHFAQVCAAVAEVALSPGRPVPTVLTCGLVEENRANNEEMAATLAGQGYPIQLRLVRDAHTMIGWRDTWHPVLDELVTRLAFGGRRG